MRGLGFNRIVLVCSAAAVLSILALLLVSPGGWESDIPTDQRGDLRTRAARTPTFQELELRRRGETTILRPDRSSEDIDEENDPVFEDRNSRRGSIVRWCVARTGTCPADTNPGDDVGELHIHFADPDARTFRLSVAFDNTVKSDSPLIIASQLYGPLWPPADIKAYNPAGKLAIREAKSYDANGVDISAAYAQWISGIW